MLQYLWHLFMYLMRIIKGGDAMVFTVGAACMWLGIGLVALMLFCASHGL